mmetsp:Transcript_1436/g.5809  ORF Transcript_1436/g.5809 Transcript_1436/m.5809 type:complete len:285 (+) Transcript_1436:1829-2683(+)
MGLAATASSGSSSSPRSSSLPLLFLEGALVFLLFRPFASGFAVIVAAKVSRLADVVAVSATDLVVASSAVSLNVSERFFLFPEARFLTLMGTFVFPCVTSFVNVFCSSICEPPNKSTSMRAASSCVSTSAGASGVIDRSSAAYAITASGNGTSNGPTGSIWCCTSAASVLANKSRSVLSDTPSARSFPRFTSYDVVPGLIRNISLPSLALTALFAPAMFKIVAKNVSGSGAPYQYEFLSNVVPKIVTSMNSTRFLYGSSAPMFRMCPRPRNLSNDFVRCRIFLR